MQLIKIQLFAYIKNIAYIPFHFYWVQKNENSGFCHQNPENNHEFYILIRLNTPCQNLKKKKKPVTDFSKNCKE